MKKKTGVAIFVVFCACVAFGAILAIDSNRPEEVMHLEFGVSWMRQLVGTVLASLAALLLLLGALNHEPLPRLASLIVAFFGGLLLVSMHWALVASIAIMFVACLLQESLYSWRSAEGAEDA